MSADELRYLVTSFPDRETADRAARTLVDAGLAVCAQVGADLVSHYRWHGTVKHEAEVAVTFKVLAVRFDLFTGELKMLHPYDTPELCAWPIDWVDPDYLAWAKGEGE